MMLPNPFTAWAIPGGEEDCCAYLIQDGHRERCREPTELGSSYCPSHHAITHLAHGSEAEAALIHNMDVIARYRGAQMGTRSVGPLPVELDRLERSEIIAIARRGNWFNRPARIP